LWELWYWYSMGKLKNAFALWSFRLMDKRAQEVVEAFPSYAFNRNYTDILAKNLVVALAANFWAGMILGVPIGGTLATLVIWLVIFLFG
jgi:hypothetical protein